jgi:hypothetical protein
MHDCRRNHASALFSVGRWVPVTRADKINESSADCRCAGASQIVDFAELDDFSLENPTPGKSRGALGFHK